MKTIATWLVLTTGLLPAMGSADSPLAKGQLLVATEVVQGDLFAQTVVLLLHYDKTGAMGLVINRPGELEPQEAIADFDVISAYAGPMYWGGPVRMNRVFALLRTDTPPTGAQTIADWVHAVPIDDRLKDFLMDENTLRFFFGCAGWGAGQLDRELARGSWHVVPSSAETVFAEDPGALWKRLMPPREHRAGLPPIGTIGLWRSRP